MFSREVMDELKSSREALDDLKRRNTKTKQDSARFFLYWSVKRMEETEEEDPSTEFIILSLLPICVPDEEFLEILREIVRENPHYENIIVKEEGLEWWKIKVKNSRNGLCIKG